MQCKCCMHSVRDGSAVCDICGFPLLASPGTDIDKIAADFRAQRLEGCSVAVMIYYYEADDLSNLVERNSEYVLIGNALSLEYQQILWLDYEFNPPDVQRSIELDVRVLRPDSYTEKKLTADIGDTLKCSALGMYLDEGLTIRLAVGSPERYVLTDAASLIEE